MSEHVHSGVGGNSPLQERTDSDRNDDDEEVDGLEENAYGKIPEAALIDLNGAIGTWLGDRFSLGREQVRTLAYAGVAGAFVAFFGAAPVGGSSAAVGSG